MLKIGEFSKLSRVSIRMLRHYDDICSISTESISSLMKNNYKKNYMQFDQERLIP